MFSEINVSCKSPSLSDGNRCGDRSAAEQLLRFQCDVRRAACADIHLTDACVPARVIERIGAVCSAALCIVRCRSGMIYNQQIAVFIRDKGIVSRSGFTVEIGRAEHCGCAFRPARRVHQVCICIGLQHPHTVFRTRTRCREEHIDLSVCFQYRRALIDAVIDKLPTVFRLCQQNRLRDELPRSGRVNLRHEQ